MQSIGADMGRIERSLRFLSLGLTLVVAVALFCEARAGQEFFPPELFPDTLISVHDSSLRVPTGISLAGYGQRAAKWDFTARRPNAFFFEGSEGFLDEIRIKVFALKNTNHREAPLVFVSLDILAVTDAMRTAISEKAGIPRESLILTATHTHSGPGGFVRNFALEVGGFDLFMSAWFEELTGQVAESVKRALLSFEPGILYSLEFAVEGLQLNRIDRARQVDREVKALVAKSYRGHWLGGMVNFAVHGTALGPQNKLVSGDLPSAIEREIESFIEDQNRVGGHKLKPTILFINGAEGDINPRTGNYLSAARLFRSVFEMAWTQKSRIFIEGNPWRREAQRVSLGAPRAGNCLQGRVLYEVLGTPYFRKHFPEDAIAEVYRIGPIVMATWPGEAVSAYGGRIKGKIKAVGGIPWFLGLAGDYLLYFTTPEEFARGGYEACLSIYGPQGGEKIMRALATLISED